MRTSQWDNAHVAIPLRASPSPAAAEVPGKECPRPSSANGRQPGGEQQTVLGESCFPRCLLAFGRWLGGGADVDRKRLMEIGFGAFAAYGVLSNINAGVLVTIAWLTIVKTTHQTPMAPGRWKPFLAVYGGLWATSHLLRPLRLSLALAAAPYFDAVLNRLMQITGWQSKMAALGIMLLGIALGTCTLLFLTIWSLGGFL